MHVQDTKYWDQSDADVMWHSWRLGHRQKMIICSVIWILPDSRWIPCESRVCFVFCVGETAACLVCGLVCLQNSDFVVRELSRCLRPFSPRAANIVTLAWFYVHACVCLLTEFAALFHRDFKNISSTFQLSHVISHSCALTEWCQISELRLALRVMRTESVVLLCLCS